MYDVVSYSPATAVLLNGDTTGSFFAWAELDDVDVAGYSAVMKREAANLRDFCADVLRGDWTVRRDAQQWLQQKP